MELKKSMMYGMIGGLSVLAYIKYKDGTMDRMLKNMKPIAPSCANGAVYSAPKKLTLLSLAEGYSGKVCDVFCNLHKISVETSIGRNC